MTRHATFAILVLVAAFGACRAARPASRPSNEISPAVLEPYLKIDEALAADRTDGVSADATQVAGAARAIGATAVDEAAVALASAGSLAEARARFGDLNEALDAYMAAHHLKPPANVRAAFCPMVLKPWLQKDGPLRNPYFGSQMLTCGSFRP